MKSKLFFLTPLLFTLLLISCNKDDSIQESQDQYKSFNKPGNATIFDIAVAAGFNQLAGAIVYADSELGAGLLETIQSDNVQLTVFAPTDEAFGNLLTFIETNRPADIPGPVTEITDVPAEIVLAVLQYHLTKGRRGSNSVVPPRGVKTIQTFLSGASFQVDNEAVITDAAGQTSEIGSGVGSNINVSASNGMVHEIGTVLLPLAPNDIWDLWRSLITPPE